MSAALIDKAQLFVRVLNAQSIGAVVAGGFPRDLIYQRPIKDVDVLVEVGNVQGMHDAIPAIALALGVSQFDLRFKGGSGYRDVQRRGDGSLVFGVLGADTCTFGYPVDVIFTDSIEQFIDGFPDDLSKVVFDGTAADPRPESLADFTARRITYHREEGDANQMSRIQRLQEKYPGFELVYRPRPLGEFDGEGRRA